MQERGVDQSLSEHFFLSASDDTRRGAKLKEKCFKDAGGGRQNLQQVRQREGSWLVLASKQRTLPVLKTKPLFDIVKLKFLHYPLVVSG